MEDALRWGVEHIFSHQHYITEQPQDTDAATSTPSVPTSAAAAASPHDLKMEDAPSPLGKDASSPRGLSHPTQAAGTAAAEATPSPRGTPASASPEPGMQSPFGAPEQQQQPKSHSKNSSPTFQPVYTDRVVEKVLEWSMSPSRQAKGGSHPRSEEAAEDKAISVLGGGVQSLGAVLGSGWSCVKLHEWSHGQLDDEAQADEGSRLCSASQFAIASLLYSPCTGVDWQHQSCSVQWAKAAMTMLS